MPGMAHLHDVCIQLIQFPSCITTCAVCVCECVCQSLRVCESVCVCGCLALMGQCCLHRLRAQTRCIVVLARPMYLSCVHKYVDPGPLEPRFFVQVCPLMLSR